MKLACVFPAGFPGADSALCPSIVRRISGLLLIIWLLAPGLCARAGETYTVRKGDTLYKISRQHGLRVNELVDANPVLRTRGLQTGMRLDIPTADDPDETAAPPPPPEPSRPTPPRIHVVARGETFSAIARKHGMSLKTLQHLNPSINPRKLRVGQKLVLVAGTKSGPVRSGEPEPTPGVFRPSLNPDLAEDEEEPDYQYLTARILKRIDAPKIAKGRWKYIVIHHSATTEGNARYFDYFHRTVRGWENGLAYHFVIGNGVDSGDGEVEVGGRWDKQLQGGHIRGDDLNQVSIGICLVGNYDKTPPSRAQMIALIELIRQLDRRCGKPYPEVLMHREINPRHTACPGTKFPIRQLRELLKDSPI
ncbi:MAG: LysM peptidoglycan-binding domain-containing protein [Verrucomicrobiae bacterium]|nr:LysM peptidoglycan-binding domain-containing protein [Verrucomicrobiae bacterium]